ncbi:MAG: LytR C-terminal domain-containing protein [Candidatus Levybacteria bacterium]|nr:LytR C-terminal domain-containing protein [Candidatus Levybacteria bacterium]
MKRLATLLRKFLSIKLLIPAVLVIALIAGAAGVYFFNQYNKAQKLLNSPAQLNAEESQEVIKKIGKLIELPNETPTLATVSDINKLKDQPFFAKAKNGDKVLVYSQAKKAVIYRPSTNKIIEVSSVSLTDSKSVQAQTTGAPTPTATKTVGIVLYNGTKTAGLAKSVGVSLESKFSNVEVVSTANASGNYSKNLVIDLTGDNKSLAQNIAKELKGEVGNLPEGEIKPDADILIIVASE